MGYYDDSIRIDIDEENISLKFDIISDTGFNLYNNKTPLFCYDYLNLSEDEFSFHHQDFDSHDYKIYFEQVKKFSGIPLSELIDDYKQSDHFRISTNPNLTERNLLNAILETTNIAPNQYPPFGHFHLYTPSNKIEGQKAPRIHFFLGRFAVLYILFYDPYHSLHPTNH